ncbi:MAG: AraC family transcriptional regulator [Bacilli bacterium]|nr:AraC family transcriptional regulator [Bacilli bacterium]
MDWILRLNKAIDYIESHLCEEIDYNELSKIAFCSSYHFQRMFAYMAGITLSEYIRKRRMTEAVKDLQNGIKVIDVALKYGYESPTAFNRAFKNVHSFAPSQAKNFGMSFKIFLPISFKLVIKGEAEMNYRIEKREAFRIIGVSKELTKDIEKNFVDVPKMWNKMSENGTVGKIVSFMKNKPQGLLGVCTCGDEETWKYFIAVANDKDVVEGFDEYMIPESTWAIFSGEGVMPLAIQELQKRIVTEWLPTSGYEYTNTPDMEVYLNSDPKNSKFEVWIPVTKK